METNASFTPASLGFSPRAIPSHRSISARARTIWRSQHSPAGNDLAIWLLAERRLTAEGRISGRSIRQRLREGYAPNLGRGRSATSL